MLYDEMSYDEIVDILDSDMFDNDILSKVDYIQTMTNNWTVDELLELYANLGQYPQ